MSRPLGGELSRDVSQPLGHGGDLRCQFVGELAPAGHGEMEYVDVVCLGEIRGCDQGAIDAGKRHDVTHRAQRQVRLTIALSNHHRDFVHLLT